MEFGLFSLFDFFRDQQDEVRYFQDTLDLSILAEELGFDSVWFGEEHFYSFWDLSQSADIPDRGRP